MYIHDDAAMETIVAQTAATIREATRHIGKADKAIRADQIAELEVAIADLQTMIDLKRPS